MIPAILPFRDEKQFNPRAISSWLSQILISTCLGTKLPIPNLDEETSPFNVQFRVRFCGEGPNSDGWYHRRQIPHCSEFTRSYFVSIQGVPPDPQTLTTHAPPA